MYSDNNSAARGRKSIDVLDKYGKILGPTSQKPNPLDLTVLPLYSEEAREPV